VHIKIFLNKRQPN